MCNGQWRVEAELSMLLFPFVILSAFGLVLSMVAHGAAVLGFDPFGKAVWALHVGICVVWLPAAVLANYQSRRFGPGEYWNDFWRVVLRACPGWMKWLAAALFGYAVVNFVWCAAFAARGPGGAMANVAAIRAFSGHWMAFYAAAMAVLYSSMFASGASVTLQGRR